MEQNARVYWGLVVAHLLTASFGTFLNDDSDQAAALHNLAHGSLLVEEVPESAYQIGTNVSWQRRWDERPVASTPLNVLALPIYFGAQVLDSIAPIQFWISAVATIAIWRVAGRALPWRDSELMMLGSLATWILLARGMRFPGPDVQYYSPVIALNLTSLLLAIAGSILAFRVVRRRTSEPWARIVLVALVAGPWLFWAHFGKYHMLAGVTFLGILACLQGPPTRQRQLVVGLLLGFAYWVNFGVGIVAFVATALLEFARIAKCPHRAAGGRLWAPLVLGIVVGLAPSFAENSYLFGNPLTSFYFANGETSTGGAAAPENVTSPKLGQAIMSLPGAMKHVLHWNGPADWASNLLSALTLGLRVEGEPLGVFLVSPLLALGVLGGALVVRGPKRDEDVSWAVAALVVHAALATNAAVRQGAGYDARLWFHMLPLLALLAAFFTGRLSSPGSLRAVASASMGFFAIVWTFLQIVTRSGYSVGAFVRPTFYAMFALGSAAIMLSIGNQIRRRELSMLQIKTIAIAMTLAIPIFWTSVFAVALAEGLPTTDQNPGAIMMAPGMDSVSEFLYRGFHHKTLQPVVWTENGTLAFHPDYGNCLVVPNPCPDIPMPESLRRRLEAVQKDTAEA